MKRATNKILVLALMALAMGITSCGDDDVNSTDGNKEYLFSASCRVTSVDGDETGELRKQQQEYVDAALAKVGFTGDAAYPLCISGKDSASVSKVLLEKIAQVEKAISDAPVEINTLLRVAGAEKHIVNSDDKKVRRISTWYKKSFGAPQNGAYISCLQWDDDPFCLFVKKLSTKVGSWGASSDDYWTIIGCDLNADTDGGDEVYLKFEHSGKLDEWFKWEESCSNEYITDVVAVISRKNAACPPITIKVNGTYRTYTREYSVCDLNSGMPSRPWIWLYTYRGHFPESDGKYYYLNTGSHIGNGCCTLSNKGSFDAASYARTTPFVDKGHKFIERVVPMYDVDGNLVQKEADANLEAGGYYVKLILAYATKEGGY